MGRWCCLTISSSAAPFSFCLQSFPSSGSFLMIWLCIRWPKYWSFSFSISPSNEYSGLISFRIDCLTSLAVLIVKILIFSFSGWEIATTLSPQEFSWSSCCRASPETPLPLQLIQQAASRSLIQCPSGLINTAADCQWVREKDGSAQEWVFWKRQLLRRGEWKTSPGYLGKSQRKLSRKRGTSEDKRPPRLQGLSVNHWEMLEICTLHSVQRKSSLFCWSWSSLLQKSWYLDKRRENYI